jgi:DNA-binding transcriptional ArsR family regulator
MVLGIRPFPRLPYAAHAMGRACRALGIGHCARVAHILNQMVQYSPGLDRTFSALADPHRRQILDRLGAGPVSVSQLAAPLDMSLPGVLKHVRALEAARLVQTHKQGRTRWCRLSRRPLDQAGDWIDRRRDRWERQLDQFVQHLEEMKATKR